MSHIIDQLINLDTDHYLSKYKDVQAATKGLSETDRKLWILTHVIKHGCQEGRKYKLKTSNPEISKHSKKAETVSDDSDHDIDQLIKNFRKKHGKDDGGIRDKKKVPETDVKHKKNFFWEISH